MVSDRQTSGEKKKSFVRPRKRWQDITIRVDRCTTIWRTLYVYLKIVYDYTFCFQVLDAPVLLATFLKV